MSLIEDELVSVEIDETGMIHKKTERRILREVDGVNPITGEPNKPDCVSSSLHREVINPESRNYDERVNALVSKIADQQAVQKQTLILEREQRIAEKSAEAEAERKACVKERQRAEKAEGHSERYRESIAELERENAILRSHVADLERRLKKLEPDE